MLLIEFARNKLVWPKLVGRNRVVDNIATADVIGGQFFAGKDSYNLVDHFGDRGGKAEFVNTIGQAGGNFGRVFLRQNGDAHRGT